VTVHSAIYDLLSRGSWYTTSEIQGYLQICGQRLMSESAVSARTRELRQEKYKKQYGHTEVSSRPRSGCTAWEYRVEVSAEIQQAA
jgi:hypothetical protein